MYIYTYTHTCIEAHLLLLIVKIRPIFPWRLSLLSIHAVRNQSDSTSFTTQRSLSYLCLRAFILTEGLTCTKRGEENDFRTTSSNRDESYAIMQQLSVAALRWAEALWMKESTVVTSIQEFVKHFKEVFGRPVEDSSFGDQLLQLHQGKKTIAEYSLEFRTLASNSGWNERLLISVYRRGLNPALRLQLAIYDDSLGIEKFIQQAIHVQQRSQNCYRDDLCCHSASPQVVMGYTSESQSEGMQVDTFRLSQTERTRRKQLKLHVL